MLLMKVFSLGELQELTGATHEAVTVWSRACLLTPSVRGAQGTGTRQLFDFSDLCRCGLLQALYDCGVKPSHMHDIMAHVRDFDWQAQPPERGSGRDWWLLIESVRLPRIRVARAATFEDASERRDHVLGVNLSGLQRTLRNRVEPTHKRR